MQLNSFRKYSSLHYLKHSFNFHSTIVQHIDIICILDNGIITFINKKTSDYEFIQKTIY